MISKRRVLYFFFSWHCFGTPTENSQWWLMHWGQDHCICYSLYSLLPSESTMLFLLLRSFVYTAICRQGKKLLQLLITECQERHQKFSFCCCFRLQNKISCICNKATDAMRKWFVTHEKTSSPKIYKANWEMIFSPMWQDISAIYFSPHNWQANKAILWSCIVLQYVGYCKPLQSPNYKVAKRNEIQQQ